MTRMLDWSNSWCDEDFDPFVHDRDLDGPPELDDDDWCRSMWDPNEGWLDA